MVWLYPSLSLLVPSKSDPLHSVAVHRSVVKSSPKRQKLKISPHSTPKSTSKLHSMATLQDPTPWLHSIDYTVPTKTMGFLRHNLALARHTTESCIQNIGLPSAEVCSTCFETLSQTSNAARWTCRRLRNKSSVGDMLDELEWPSLKGPYGAVPINLLLQDSLRYSVSCER